MDYEYTKTKNKIRISMLRKDQNQLLQKEIWLRKRKKLVLKRMELNWKNNASKK